MQEFGLIKNGSLKTFDYLKACFSGFFPRGVRPRLEALRVVPSATGLPSKRGPGWLARNCGAAPFKYIIDSVWSVQWAEPTQGLAWGQRCWAPFRGSNWPCWTPAWVALGFPLGPTALRTGCGWSSSCWVWLRTPGGQVWAALLLEKCLLHRALCSKLFQPRAPYLPPSC